MLKLYTNKHCFAGGGNKKSAFVLLSTDAQLRNFLSPFLLSSIPLSQFASMSRPVSEDAEKIMHVSLPVSKETMLMGSDTGGEWASNYSQGNNFSISINTDTKEEADRFFNGLSAGGVATMPMNKTFWGDYFGMFTDKFGINWMVSFNEAQQNK